MSGASTTGGELATAGWRTRRRFVGVLVTGFRTAPFTATTLVAMSIATAAASICYSLGFRMVVDGAVAHDSSRIAWGAVLVAGLFTASWVLSILSATEGSMLTDRTNLGLSVRIARLAANVPTLEHFESSELLARLEQLTSNRRTLAGSTRQLIGLLGQALRVVGIVVLLAIVYPPMLVVPVLALAPGWANRWAARIQTRGDDALAEDRRLLSDLFTLATSADTARELRTYGISEALIERHGRLTERVRRQAVRTALVSAAVEALGWIVFALGVVGAIVVLVLRAAHGHVSPGSVVMAVSLMRRAQTQISRSTDTASSFNASLATARQLLWLEDHAGALDAIDASAAASPVRLRHGIALEQVCFRYPSADSAAPPTLGPLSLTLPAGATVAVVGENGAGKTTLVKLLCAMYSPDSGRITVDGIDLATLGAARWRERISATFQDFQRLNFRLLASVGAGDLPAVDDEDAVRDALRRADADALEAQLPDGLQTQVGNRFTGGHELSGGQWQRLALARGLMRARPLLTVLDEPTASLDAPTEASLFARYSAAAHEAAMANGGITILVSHRFATVRAADLIVVMDGGRIVETGSHAALMARGGTYAELFALQARAYA